MAATVIDRYAPPDHERRPPARLRPLPQSLPLPRIAVLLCCLALACPAFAAEESAAGGAPSSRAGDTTDPDPQSASATQTEDAAPAERAERAEAGDTEGKPSSEVFVPSEEISEDFTVSFPVDI